MLRGPYKRYEYDPNAHLPKTTSYIRRKRRYEDITEANAVRCTCRYKKINTVDIVG